MGTRSKQKAENAARQDKLREARQLAQTLPPRPTIAAAKAATIAAAPLLMAPSISRQANDALTTMAQDLEMNDLEEEEGEKEEEEEEEEASGQATGDEQEEDDYGGAYDSATAETVEPAQAPLATTAAKMMRLDPLNEIEVKYPGRFKQLPPMLQESMKGQPDTASAVLDAMGKGWLQNPKDALVADEALKRVTQQLELSVRQYNQAVSDVDNTKRMNRAMVEGFLRTFKFSKASGAVGGVTEASITKILADPVLVAKVAQLIAQAKNNKDTAAALSAVVKG